MVQVAPLYGGRRWAGFGLAGFPVPQVSPRDHAFSQLSVLLGCIRHLTTEAEMENDRVAGSAARILNEMAKALIDDMERGMNRVH